MYKSFIPTKYFNTVTKEWTEINEIQEDWLLDNEWCENVRDIVRISDDFIMVIWNELMESDRYASTIYLGTFV